ncbi:unnamed protein product [Ectocarpus sp. 6 AP-2014]
MQSTLNPPSHFKTKDWFSSALYVTRPPPAPASCDIPYLPRRRTAGRSYPRADIRKEPAQRCSWVFVTWNHRKFIAAHSTAHV